MRRLNEEMDLKFLLLIFRQFHGAITRSQKNVYVHSYDSALGTISVSGPCLSPAPTALHDCVWPGRVCL